MKPFPCPCCLSAADASAAGDRFACPNCGHRWRLDAPAHVHYAALSGRNAVGSSAFERKTRERLDCLRPLVADDMRILEIGCAEGEFGARVKSLADVTYVGVEPSADAGRAAARLDRVHRAIVDERLDAPFDLILAFHVLEHIPAAEPEIVQWLRLLAPAGNLLIETPNRSGNPLLEDDLNPEHAHQFTPASLLMLVQRVGLDARSLTGGHYESSLYCDSLRLLATPRLSAEARAERLRRRFRACLGDRFVVYGAGGDFRNYVEPLLAALPIAAICDSDSALHGCRAAGYEITAYDAAALRGLPVLVASSRHHAAIAAQLQTVGVPSAHIHGLEEIYGAGP